MGLYTDPDYFEKQSSYQESKKSKVIKSIRDHFIRPCYLRESETPLKFYKLIRVCLPIGAILNFSAQYRQRSQLARQPKLQNRTLS